MAGALAFARWAERRARFIVPLLVIGVSMVVGAG